ncbi:hypothetical protein SprV_0301246400 [Sparganum proliferum]
MSRRRRRRRRHRPPTVLIIIHSALNNGDDDCHLFHSQSGDYTVDVPSSITLILLLLLLLLIIIIIIIIPIAHITSNVNSITTVMVGGDPSSNSAFTPGSPIRLNDNLMKISYQIYTVANKVPENGMYIETTNATSSNTV